MWALYLLFPLAFATSDWYIIEKQNRYPDKTLMFILRVTAALLFGAFLVAKGYWWLWVCLYLPFGFWWPFNTLLNIFRGKRWWYLDVLDAEDSKIDQFFKKTLGEYMTFAFGLILFLSVVGIMYYYGGCTYSEINGGWCR